MSDEANEVLTLPYFDKEELRVLKMSLLHFEPKVRRRRWDDHLDSVRTTSGDLYIVECKKKLYVVYLNFQSATSDPGPPQRISEIISRVNRSSNGSSDLDATQFGFELLTQLKSIRISTKDSVEWAFTMILRKDRIVAFVFAEADAEAAVQRTRKAIEAHMTFRRSVTDPSLLIVDCSQLPPLRVVANADGVLARAMRNPADAALTELAKLTEFVRDIGNLPSAKLPKQVRSFDFTINRARLASAQHSPREAPLTPDEYDKLKLASPDHVRSLICKRGLDPLLRPKLWDVLTGFLNFDMTEEERRERIDTMAKEYETISAQWRNMSPSQVLRNSPFRERRGLIEKDVARIPESLLELRGKPRCEWSQILKDVLTTFMMYDHDIGYSQGISDIVLVLANAYATDAEERVAARLFGPLCSLMDNFFGERFNQDNQTNLLEHMSRFRRLVEFADPELKKYLKRNNSVNMFFSFRWLIVWFAREFRMEPLLRLWDALLSQWPCHKNFDLFVGLALLQHRRDDLMKEDLDFDGTLRFINSMADEHLDADKIVAMAVELYSQISDCPNLPSEVAKIVERNPTVDHSP